MSFFLKIPQTHPVRVLTLNKQYHEDPFEKKAYLGVGGYRTENGEPWILPVVKEAEKVLLNDFFTIEFENDVFTKAATKMLVGDNYLSVASHKVFSTQSTAGGGALRLGAEFLATQLGLREFYCSNPTWGNYKQIFKNAGFTNEKEYRYWSKTEDGLDFQGLLDDLSRAPERSVVILQACAHNPTGCDPSLDQWSQIADVVKKGKLFPFFDAAFQGLATGDLDRDASAVRLFLDKGIELFCAQSFSKNLGLYNERVGNLVVVLNDPKFRPNVKRQFEKIKMALYKMSSNHGARIVTVILNDEKLLNLWKNNLETMLNRIAESRKQLRSVLESLETPGNWSKVTNQVGMATYVELNEKQMKNMVDKHHVYVLDRINVCGLTSGNLQFVAKALHESLTNPNFM